MCGIACWVEHKNRQVDFDRFTSKIKHRGPDYQSNIKLEENVYLGNTRLAIIDNHARSNQPFQYKHFSISFNGAISNFKELKQTLESKGHQFQTEGDTEVLLHAFEEYGPSCVSRFHGMWVFVIYDALKKQLFVCRDRFGIKPLYYYRNIDRLVIGSELKQFVELSDTINERQVQYYLESGGFKNHSKDTFRAQVFQLEPGHHFTYDIGSGNMQMSRYYSLSETDVPDSKDIVELIEKSIDYRMIADIKPGMLFSGGLDSSIILYHLLQRYPETQSYSFIEKGDSELDESEFIQAFLERFPHNNNQVELPDNIDQLLNECLYYQDEPPASLSVVAQFLLYKLAKSRGEKLCLSGQGADELFGGYPRFLSFVNKKHLLMNPLRAMLFAKDNFHKMKSFFAKDNSANLFTKKTFEFPQINSQQEYMQYLIEQNGLRDLLHYEDRNSMACGIETRVPFLDHTLVEYAYHMPTDVKLLHFETKGLLRDVYSKVLPKKIVQRKKKLAFDTPEERLLKSGIIDATKVYEECRARFPELSWTDNVNFDNGVFQVWQMYFLNKMYG